MQPIKSSITELIKSLGLFKTGENKNNNDNKKIKNITTAAKFDIEFQKPPTIHELFL